MTDETLRELERRWRETATPVDEQAYQRARARAGLPQLALVLRVSNHFVMNGGARVPGCPFDEVVGELCARSDNVVVDGSRLLHISSTELGVLVKYADKVAESGGALVVCALTKKTGAVFEMLGLVSYFNISPTVEEALLAQGWEVLATVDHVLATTD